MKPPSPATALAATLAIQVYTSLAATAAAALAPVIAAGLGVPAQWVGGYVGIVYTGAAVASLLCGAFIARYGAIRVSQACVVLCAIGIAGVAASPAGALVLVALSAFVLGVGYGPITPASSHVLVRTTPPKRMSLVFSIKQTGVPVGAALAGALLPALALAAGWRVTLVAIAVLGAIVVVVAQAIRAALDVDRRADAPAAVAHAFANVRRVLAHRAIATLAYASFAYSAIQVSLTSFLVVHLTDVLGWSLVAAGFALSAATVGGVAGRIFWGAVSDRTGAPRRVLGVIGAISGSCAIATMLASPDWPLVATYAVVALFGATAIGWNGVMLAEVARLSPPGEAGAVTGATGFITFGGVVAGPTLFGALATVTGNTRSGFAACAVLAFVTALALGWAARARGSTPGD